MRTDRRIHLRTYAGVTSGLTACAIMLHMLDYTIKGEWDTTLGLVEISAFVALVALAIWLVTRPGRPETTDDQLEDDATEDDTVVREAFSMFERPPLAANRRLVLDDTDNELPPAA